MLFYIFLLILNIMLYLVLSKVKNGKKVYLITILSILMLISSLRSKQMGADYLVYTSIFENIKQIISFYPMEKGYLLFNLFISFFTDSYVVFSFILNFIIFSILYKYIKNNVDEKYYFWIIFIFILNPYLYIQSTFNVIRQTLAIIIVLFGIKYLNQKKYVVFTLFVILASQFHTISYIYILLIIIKFLKWDRKKFLIVAIFSLFTNIVLGSNRIVGFFAKILGYNQYVGYNTTMFNFKIYVLFIFLIALFLIWCYKKIEVKEKERFFLDTYIISISLLPIFITNDIMYRVYIGLVIISLPGISMVLRYCKKLPKLNGLIIICCYIFYYSLLFALFMRSVIVSNNINYIPFNFFWQ